MSKKKNKGYTSFVTKLGVGFDPVLDLIEVVDSTTTFDDITRLPPFNIKKTSDKDYAIEVSVPGAKKEDIRAVLDADFLTITAEVDAAVDPEGDDQYFHKGIFQGGAFAARFSIAKNLQFDHADLVDGILTVNLKDHNVVRETTTLAIGPFPKPEIEYEVKYDSAGSPTLIPVGENVNTSVDAIPLVSEPEVVVEEPTNIVVVNEVTTNVPTTEVVLPIDVIPQIIEVTSFEPTGTSINTTSSTPQATITVEDATHEIVSDTAVLEVIKTEEGIADIIVAIPEEIKAVAEANGVDIVADVKAAIESSASTAEVVTAPEVVVEAISSEVVTTENLEVTVPVELPPVMELVKTEGGESTDVSLVAVDPTELPVDAVLVPVVTQDGANDVVVAVAPELHEELVKADVDVAAEVSAAVVESAPEILTPVDTVTEIVNQLDTQIPTVEVTLPTELPQIVEVKLDEVKDVVAQASEEIQASVTVVDATAELPDNVDTIVVPTEEGKADIVVAIDSATNAELTEKGVDVLEAVKTAIEQSSEVTAPELPVIAEEVKTETVTVDEVKVEVPTELAQVVEATVENGTVVLTNVSEEIPAAVTITPVVTQEGQSDVVVVTTPETDKALEKLDVTVAELIPEAVAEVAPEVVVSRETAPVAVEPVTVDEEVKVAEPVVEAPAEITVTIDADNKKEPTVEVTLPTELPQIVEVKLDSVVDVVNTKATEPQMAVTLEDATLEVSDNVVLETVKTADGSADVIVAIPEEIVKIAEEKKIELMPAIEAAIAHEEVTAPELVVQETVPSSVEVTVKEAEPLMPASEVTLEVPLEVTPVMTAELTVADDLGKTISLVPSDENVVSTSELISVVTPEGQNDIIVAVPEEVKAVLEEGGKTVETVLTEAVAEAKVSVAEVPENLIAEESAI